MKEIMPQPLSRDTLPSKCLAFLGEVLIFRRWGKKCFFSFRILKAPISPSFTPWSSLKLIQALSASGMALLAGKNQGTLVELLPSGNKCYLNGNLKKIIFVFDF